MEQELSFSDRVQFKLRSFDVSRFRAQLYGLTWLSYGLGACFPLSTGLPMIEQEQFTWLKLFLLLSFVFLFGLMLTRGARLRDQKGVGYYTVMLCGLSFLSGGWVETFQTQRLNQQLSAQTMFKLQKHKVQGQAEVYRSRLNQQGCTHTLMISTLTLNEGNQLSRDRDQLHFDQALLVHSFQKECTEPFEQGDQVWFTGRLAWIQGRSSPFLKAKQNYLKRQHIAWQFNGELFLQRQGQAQGWAKRLRRSIQRELKHIAQRARVSEIDEETKDRSLSSHIDLGIGLVKGLVLGESKALDLRLLERVRQLGLAHLLAVSGLHIGVCALLFAWLCQRLSFLCGALLPRLWHIMGMISAAWFYVLLAQSPTSAQRAALMLSYWGLSRLCFRSLTSIECLWLTAWSLTLFQPSLCQDMGLQLSLAATLGLHTCLSRFQIALRFQQQINRERKQKLQKWFGSFNIALKASMQVALVSCLFTSPVLVAHLGELNLASVMFNTVITPLVSISFIPFTLIASLLSPWWSWPLECCVELGGRLAEFMLSFNQLKWGIWILSSEQAWTCLAFVMAYLSYDQAYRFHLGHWVQRLLFEDRFLSHGFPIRLADREHLYQRYRACFLIFLCLGFGHFFWQSQQEKKPQISFLYVGQGDATLIRNQKGEYALFDVGPPYSAWALLSNLKKRGVSQLEWVVISHLHPDHYGGLGQLIKQIPVKKVIYHGRELNHKQPTLWSQDTLTWTQLTQVLALHQIPLLTANQQAEKQSFSDWHGVRLEWMLSSPTQVLAENDASLALLVQGANKTVLLSGDLEQKGERMLQERWQKKQMSEANVKLDLWQVDHHGSRTSSQSFLLFTLQAQEAILSLDGLHRFGFPHPEVVKRLNAANMKQIRLDLYGDYSLDL